MPTITLGMATYDDFHRTQFTIQSARMHYGEYIQEYVVVDNNPGSAHGKLLKKFMANVPNGKYVPFSDYVSTSVKQKVFDNATQDWVVCVDAHVLLCKTFFPSLLRFAEASPESLDIVQGPMTYDGLATISTHFDPVWRTEMYGIWGTDQRGLSLDGQPFEIPMQGMGQFAARRETFPGFNPLFRGFGAEEGYVHEKVRQHGGAALCIPGMRWWHSFDNPYPRTPPVHLHDKIRNYLLGFIELDLPLDGIFLHFRTRKTEKQIMVMAQQALVDLWQAQLVPPDRTLRFERKPSRTASVC